MSAEPISLKRCSDPTPCAVAIRLVNRIFCVRKSGRPYVLQDESGAPVTIAQAKAIILERFTGSRRSDFPSKVIPLQGTASSADNTNIRAAIAAIEAAGQPGELLMSSDFMISTTAAPPTCRRSPPTIPASSAPSASSTTASFNVRASSCSAASTC